MLSILLKKIVCDQVDRLVDCIDNGLLQNGVKIVFAPDFEVGVSVALAVEKVAFQQTVYFSLGFGHF